MYSTNFACFFSQARRKTFRHGICGSSSSSASIEYFTFFENVGTFSSGRHAVKVCFFNFHFLQYNLLICFFPVIIADCGKWPSCKCFRKMRCCYLYTLLLCCFHIFLYILIESILLQEPMSAMPSKKFGVSDSKLRRSQRERQHVRV